MDLHYRYKLKKSDRNQIEEILHSTGVFYDHEIQVALDIADIALVRGEDLSGYHFVIAEYGNKILGFCCYGAAPCTMVSYDIYWFAVRKNLMNKGLGSKILSQAETFIREKGGENIWIETSSRSTYNSTRTFYEKRNYLVQAELPDFYAPGDNKVIFLKKILNTAIQKGLRYS